MSTANKSQLGQPPTSLAPALQSSTHQIAISMTLILLGVTCGLISLALVSNQFGNTDTIGLFLFGFAGFNFVTGVAHFFLHLRHAAVIGIIASPLFVALLFASFWMVLLATAFQNRDHQDFATSGISQIPVALQMEELYDDCDHFITYNQTGPLFNSVAYFGGRYRLTMQVPVEIRSKTSGTINGEPKFFLNEISTVTVSPSGQVGASFSNSLDFGASDWKKVHDANGDFGKIGFTIKTTAVPNFQKFIDSSRQSD